MWRYLNNNDIQVIATDHDGWSIQQKKSSDRVDQMLAGMPQLETYVTLLYSEGVRKGKISLNRLVEVCATNPAKLFGLYPKKGSIVVGSDADIVVLDVEKEIEISAQDGYSRSDFDPYEGWKATGCPVMTFSRGELIMKDGLVLGEPGRGRLLKRNTFTPL